NKDEEPKLLDLDNRSFSALETCFRLREIKTQHYDPISNSIADIWREIFSQRLRYRFQYCRNYLRRYNMETKLFEDLKFDVSQNLYFTKIKGYEKHGDYYLFSGIEAQSYGLMSPYFDESKIVYKMELAANKQAVCLAPTLSLLD